VFVNSALFVVVERVVVERVVLLELGAVEELSLVISGLAGRFVLMGFGHVADSSFVELGPVAPVAVAEVPAEGELGLPEQSPHRGVAVTVVAATAPPVSP
jgi:hypothetical protein